MSKYLAKILGNDPESLQMIAALSSGATVKVSDIKRWNNLKNDNIRENQKLIIFPKRIPKT